MEQKTENKKKVWKALTWLVVIIAFMASIHIAVNYFDMFTILQKLHGG